MQHKYQIFFCCSFTYCMTFKVCSIYLCFNEKENVLKNYYFIMIILAIIRKLTALKFLINLNNRKKQKEESIVCFLIF